jgi:hypothetical protein
VGKLAPLLSLPVIPEIARELCLTMGYKYTGEIPEQEDFKRLVLTQQIDYENKLRDFISDRSTIDCWVLWQRWNICQAMSYDTEAYYEKARAQAQEYSRIIHVPPMFEPVNDGFRFADKDYQKQIDRLVRATLYDWNLLHRTYFVKSPHLEGRVQEIAEWLGVENAEKAK